jgi:hypothetical protein
MTDKDYEWAESNDLVCSMLRNAHDVLALSSRNPPSKKWVGLTDEEMLYIEGTTTCPGNESWLRNLTRNIEAKLKEKNR